MKNSKTIFRPGLIFFFITLIMGLGIPDAISQSSGPTVVVTVLNDKIGSSVAPPFNLNIQALAQSPNYITSPLSLTVKDESGPAIYGTVYIPITPGSTVTKQLSSGDITNLYLNAVPPLTPPPFQDGHTYDFTVQATDNSSHTGSNFDHLQVDNSPPTTTFFFTDSGTQSYPSAEDWNTGSLLGTIVVGTNPSDAVMLAGPAGLFSQPAIFTGPGSHYNFNDPPASSLPPSGSGVLAISTPTYDSTVLYAGTSVQFQPVQPSSQTNLITNVINGYQIMQNPSAPYQTGWNTCTWLGSYGSYYYQNDIPDMLNDATVNNPWEFYKAYWYFTDCFDNTCPGNDNSYLTLTYNNCNNLNVFCNDYSLTFLPDNMFGPYPPGSIVDGQTYDPSQPFVFSSADNNQSAGPNPVFQL